MTLLSKLNLCRTVGKANEWVKSYLTMGIKQWRWKVKNFSYNAFSDWPVTKHFQTGQLQNTVFNEVWGFFFLYINQILIKNCSWKIKMILFPLTDNILEIYQFTVQLSLQPDILSWSAVCECLLFGCSKLQLDVIILFGWTEDREVNRYQLWTDCRR
jgi:hypothetical protein